MPANVTCTVPPLDKGVKTFCETYHAYQLALIAVEDCDLSSESHALQTHQRHYSRLKNVIFRYCYVIQRTSVLLKLRTFTVAEFFTSPKF